MCEPTTIIAGTMALVSAFASYQQNASQANVYDAQAQAQAEQAHQQVQEGASRAYQERRQARSVGASQNAALAANGVQVAGGSAFNVLADTFNEGESAAAMEIGNAYNRATTTNWNANISRTSARNLRSNNLGTSLLTGASTFVSAGGLQGINNMRSKGTGRGNY